MRKLRKGMIIAFCSLMLTGCGTAQAQTTEARTTETQTTETQTTETATTEEQTTEAKTTDDSGEVSGLYTDVAAIRIVDETDGRYEGSMLYDLTPEQVQGFIEAINESDAMDYVPGAAAFYRLNLYGEDGTLIETFEVNSHRSMIDSSGRGTNGFAIEAWLESMEEEYGITYESVWGRQPADDYFILMSEGASGSFREITETNFDQGIELDLTKDDISELTEALKDTEISKESKEVNPKYMFDVFSEDGAALYYFVVDENMKIYTDYGYELTGGGIADWVAKRIAE